MRVSVRALVVDDNPVVRAGLVSLLEAGKVRVVGEAVDGAHALEQAQRLRPDIVLLDVRMPGVDGIAAAGPLSALAKVLMLSYDTDADVIGKAIRNGAAGYLVHGAFGVDELIAAVHDTVAGRASPLSPSASRAVVEALRGGDAPSAAAPPARAARSDDLGLSPREAEVMELIARGHSNGEIARTLVVSEYTVKNHVNRIFAKLGVRTRGAAMARWLGTAR
ncbi:response regulator [Actinomadura rubrisoli]|uniref:Response regulator transcription factor n=1 Tax=Actinomadura rubrisoli TaxID=2530368 RepID=A0A4R5AH98_9ACTN|nr:response regulator transcription factor [Actinomadura rubrisoli]TDD70810.1 response regulator transcription factor [Actinomadura rubrisoli]